MAEQIEKLTESCKLCRKSEERAIIDLETGSLSIIVLGASGDLAKKKTFPALYGLHCFNLMPRTAQIIGYARSPLSKKDLIERIKPACKNVLDDEEHLNSFFDRCSYVHGPYDKEEGFITLQKHLEKLESDFAENNRLFYLALPPSVFITAVSSFNSVCRSATGWNRVVIEKPFGRDLESSRELVRGLAQYLAEDEQYRIDHYLGKEMVQNLLVLRFANFAFQPLWSRSAVNSVTITFKEPFGTEGRGGYFDNIGIIRDVMQNHLLQVLSLVAMERPVSLSAEHVRDEKVKVLKCIPPLKMENLLIGQYVADEEGKHPSYTDDEGVPNDSRCATFAAAVFYIKNERWDGVPFILKCGKALNERKAEIRLQFNDVPGQLFDSAVRNELVIRIQPNESAYMKVGSLSKFNYFYQSL